MEKSSQHAYRHLKQGVYATFFDDQLIALDLTADQYVIFSQEASCHIARLTGVSQTEVSRQSLLPLKADTEHLFEAKTFPDPDARIRFPAHNLRGTPTDFWNIKKEDVSNIPTWRELLRALTALHKVHGCAARERLRGLVDMLRAYEGGMRHPYAGEFESLSRVLNVACLIYPTPTKCLEWACALMLLGARMTLRSTLVIGVQNKPFFAHAWVEVDHKVVGDEPCLRKLLAVIYEFSLE